MTVVFCSKHERGSVGDNWTKPASEITAQQNKMQLECLWNLTLDAPPNAFIMRAMYENIMGGEPDKNEFVGQNGRGVCCFVFWCGLPPLGNWGASSPPYKPIGPSARTFVTKVSIRNYWVPQRQFFIPERDIG